MIRMEKYDSTICLIQHSQTSMKEHLPNKNNLKEFEGKNDHLFN